MNCHEIGEILNDYIDGTLPEEDENRVRDHLGGCSSCRDEEAQLRLLVREAGALPRDIPPGRDLWPELESRLGKEEDVKTPGRRRAGPQWWSRGVLAAAAILVIVVGVVLTAVYRGEKATSPGAAKIVESPDVLPAAGTMSDFTRAEAEYIQATDRLYAALHARKDNFRPETWAVVEENLRTIHGAVREINKALENDPGNHQLGTLLMATYQQEVELLRQTMQLSTEMQGG
jgi:hypothetical protein